MYVYVCMYVCMDICMYVCTRFDEWKCVCVYIYMYVCMYLCIYVCMYVRMYVHGLMTGKRLMGCITYSKLFCIHEHSMRARIYIYIHTYIHTHIYIHTYIYIQIYIVECIYLETYFEFSFCTMYVILNILFSKRNVMWNCFL